ncbi:MAG: Gx transporter family protein [Bacilli bacterium]|nr:Gx transporter family protein [Bacilli bacterium]
MKRFNVHKMTLMAILLALAIALGIAESFIPSAWIPGLKPGFANIVICLTLYEFGIPEALFIDLARVLVVALLRGTFLQMGFWMSFAGATCSLLMMILGKYVMRMLTVIGVSTLGSLVHSFAQVCVGAIFMESTAVFYYYPFMMLISLASGILVGVVVDRIMATGVLEKQKKIHGYR